MLSDWISKSLDPTAVRAVALAGRVPVKVSSENGPIKQGDLLAPASYPGVAMSVCGSRQCTPAFVVGVALEPFDSSDPRDIGSVMMMTYNQWFVPSTSMSVVSSVPTSTTVDRGVMSADQAGFATVRAGDESVDVVFSEPFTVTPVITVSLASDVVITRSYITAMTKRGFRIAISPRASNDVLFTWHALGVSSPVNFYGNIERQPYALTGGVVSDYAPYYGQTTGVINGGTQGATLPSPVILQTDVLSPSSSVPSSTPIVTEPPPPPSVDSSASTETISNTPETEPIVNNGGPVSSTDQTPTTSLSEETVSPPLNDQSTSTP